MADRYWVGGTASWDGTAGTKWAATSGGAGGASVPTSADDVFFDAASGAATVTIATGNTGARSINCTGFTGTITGTAAISVAGSITLNTTMGWTHTGTVSITGTGTLTSAGKTFSPLTINGAGITTTLGDALNIGSGVLTITQGTFTTNNFNVTASSLLANNSNVKTFNLGSSVVTLTGSGVVFSVGTSNTTFNAGTSTIILSGGPTATLQATGQGGLTYNNVSFTNTALTTASIQGTNTFNNISVAATSSSSGTTQVTISGNQTINGTLSTTSTAGNRRIWFRSDTYGVRRTLTVNSAPSLTDADFRDIIVNGTAAPISGTRIGNRGACTGITFSAPKTVYWCRTGSLSWADNAWAATSGGLQDPSNFPLPQDTAVIDDSALIAGQTISVGLSIGYISNIDMSGRTNAMTFNFDNSATCYGSWITGSGVTYSGTIALTFSGEGTKTITSAGKTFSCPITIDAYGGTVELTDAFNIGSNTLTITNGTFNTKNFSVTASILSSNNSNVRTIKLGSSTLSLSGTSATVVNFSTSTNLTFDAGTSQINCTAQNAQSINGGSGQTFYNVAFTNGGIVSNNQKTISGANTFNNLTFPTTGETGLIRCIISANQVVNGTLTCAGGLATRRIFLLSDILGTTRTITANALSANDCDFRDITIAGAAAGTAPTRAGDCGGNSGITFPAPKTVYYRMTGFSGWGFDNQAYWSFTDGGTATQSAFPLAQDTATFLTYPTTSGGGASIGDAWNIGNIDMSARTSTLTYIEATSNCQMYGNFISGSAVQTFSSNGGITFSGRGTQTITSAGTEFKFNLTVDKPSGKVQLADALALSSIRTLTLTSGELDAVSYNVTTSQFTAAQATTLRMGSGLWTLTGTGAVWNLGSNGINNFFKGTADILLSDNTTTSRTFAGGGLSYNKLTIGGNTSTSTTTITQNNQFTELASTKTVAHTIALGTTAQTFGKWSVTGTAGNVVTLTGTGTAHALAGSATSGIDYLAMGSIGFGGTAEFYAGANSTGTAGAPVFRTAAPTPRTLYWVGGTGNWSNTARWSLSSGGAGGQAIPTSLDNVIFDSASNATAYTVTIDAISRCNQLTIAAPASGNVTLTGTSALICHGNVTLPATGLTRTFTGTITLSGSTTGKTFTTNGVALQSTITVNGVGCGWTLGSALDTTGNSLTITNGSFDTGNYTISTIGLISSSNSNTRSITLGSSTITLSNNNGTTTFSDARNLTFNAGTSQINISPAGHTINGGGLTFNNVSFTNTAINTATITGTNTFNNLTVAGRTSAGLANLSINANQTINGTLTLSAGTDATMRTFVRSDTLGTTRTLTCNAVSATDVDFRDITIAGSAAPVSGTRLGDCRGNTGITFPAPKTVYFRATGTSNWGSGGSWSLTNGGTAVSTAFPLAQDTGVFTTTYPSSGSTVTINAAYNIGTVDMSARTNAMTLANGSNIPAIYGDWINGAGTTVTGTGALAFANRGTQTLTSAGKTFPQAITINCPGGSIVLQDNFTTSSASTQSLLVLFGTFNANNFNFTTSGGVDLSSGTQVRGVNIGSGTWTLGGSGTAWGAGTPTNLTVTGTGTIKTSSVSAKTFAGGDLSYSGITLDNSGAGTLTITGNNSFANIISTSIPISGNNTIDLSTTTQRLGNFTGAGQAGPPGPFYLIFTGNTSNLIYTGAGIVRGIDYLNVQGRAYGPNGETSGIWYAGANSTNNGSFGWEFTTAPEASNSNFFLLFA